MGGEEIAVHVSIHTLGGFSEHASRYQLLEWLKNAGNRAPDYILCTVSRKQRLHYASAFLMKGGLQMFHVMARAFHSEY